MIDFIKTKEIKLAENNYLEWIEKTNTYTGEVFPYKIAKIEGLVFIKKLDKVFLKGSLHKFSNGGLHNYNEFDFRSLCRAIDRLSRITGTDPSNILLENIEFGLNVKVPRLPDNYVNAAIGHKTTPFRYYNPDKIKRGVGVMVLHQDYLLKLYSKSNQYELSEYVIRFEIRVNKMKYFSNRNIKISSLADLKNPDILMALQATLRSTLKDIFIIGPIDNINAFTLKQQKLLLPWTSPQTWEKRLVKKSITSNSPEDGNYEKARRRYYKDRKAVLEIMDDYGLNAYHNELIHCFEDSELFNFSGPN